MIKRLFLFFFWIGVILLAMYQARSSKTVMNFIHRSASLFSTQQKTTSTRAGSVSFTGTPSSKTKANKAASSNMATLYLKNSGVISGELLWEKDGRVALLWQGGEIEFAKGEIERIQKGEFHAEKEGFLFPVAQPEKWPYKNDVVIHLKDQRILDETISNVQGEKVILRRQLEEGGVIEQEIARSQIEFLAFKPVQNKKSQKIEESLRTQFPKMKWVREGFFTLVTDSYATWVNEYRHTIRELATDFYLKFFPLLSGRSPNLTNFVVVFDEWGDFMEYAATDGVPGWAVAGYFSPDSEVLFLFNTLGDSFSKLIEEAIMGQTGRRMSGAVEAVKGQVDKRYHVFVEEQAEDVMKKFSAAHSVIRGRYREETLTTLRHELTHELFHNWGLQSIVVSKLEGSQGEEAKKKRSFLEEKDIQRKRELLLELVHLRGSKPIQVAASNSWFVEGLAAYMETVPAGEPNKRWLYLFQQAKRKNALFPIEHLTVYKMGSFPGIAWEAMQYAYAESWAFVYFLMNRYPAEFTKYLERFSREKPKENEDIHWLLEALGGKNMRALEGEFLEYMNQFPELEDPYLEEFDMMRNIFQG